VTFTKSNNSGHYDFRNVPAGCYKIYVDIAGLPMDSTYTFCVTSNDTVPDLNFIADANSIFITNSALSVSQTNIDQVIRVYPNPAVDMLKIFNPSGVVISYTLYDITGKNIISEKASASNDIEINTAYIDKGVYILQINHKHQQKNYRIIKQ
jgi:hypothetical protein